MGVRRNVGPHRVPGICISLTGFLLLFAGIMMVAMSLTAQDSDRPEIKIGGGVCLVLGAGSVTGGFIYQYIVHRDWKRKKLAKEQRRKANREIISQRAKAYLEDNPMEGTSGSMVDLGITSPRDVDFGPVNGLHNPMGDEDIMADEDASNFVPYDLFQVGTPTPEPSIIIHDECETPRSGSTTPQIICHMVIDEDDSSSEENIGDSSPTKIKHNIIGDFVVERSVSKSSMRGSDIGSSTTSLGSRSVYENDSAEEYDKKGAIVKRKQRTKVKFKDETPARTPSNVSLRSSGNVSVHSSVGNESLNGSLREDDGEEDMVVIKRKKRRKKDDKDLDNKTTEQAQKTTNNDVADSDMSEQTYGKPNKGFPSVKGKATAGKRIKGIYAKKSQELAPSKLTSLESTESTESKTEETSRDGKSEETKKDVSDSENWDTECSESEHENSGKFKVQNGVIVHSSTVIEKYLKEETEEPQFDKRIAEDLRNKRKTFNRRFSNWDSDNDFSDADTITIDDRIVDSSLPDMGSETCDSRCS